MEKHVCFIGIMPYTKSRFLHLLFFYVIDKVNAEVHILRILREECDWESFFISAQEYTYPEK